MSSNLAMLDCWLLCLKAQFVKHLSDLIFLPKIIQNPSKNRSQDASIFRSIFASIFLRYCFRFLHRYLREGWFMLGLSSFSVFWASWPPLGALWARFGKVRASILEVFGAQFLHNFQVVGSHFFSNLSPVLKHLLY